jgi:hypothetical protein
MLISSDANGAQLLESGQPTRFYDDIGCLAADPRARSQNGVRYVRLASGGWSTPEDAWFARPASVKTPMDYGFVAYNTDDDARKNDRDGQAHRWPAVIEFAEAR